MTLDLTPLPSTPVDPDDPSELARSAPGARQPLWRPGVQTRTLFSRRQALPGQRPRSARHADGSAIIGDGRNDENQVIAQIHVAFLRAHNALIDQGYGLGARAKSSSGAISGSWCTSSCPSPGPGHLRRRLSPRWHHCDAVLRSEACPRCRHAGGVCGGGLSLWPFPGAPGLRHYRCGREPPGRSASPKCSTTRRATCTGGGRLERDKSLPGPTSCTSTACRRPASTRLGPTGFRRT